MEMETSEMNTAYPSFRHPINHNASSSEWLDNFLGKDSYALLSLWITFLTESQQPNLRTIVKYYPAVNSVVNSNTHRQAHCSMTSLGGSALSLAYRQGARKTKETADVHGFFEISQ